MVEKRVFNQFSEAYTLIHPVRASIIRLLRKQGEAYISQIAKALGFSERLIAFHLSMLYTGGFVDREYHLSTKSPPRVSCYYRLTPKVDVTLRTLVDVLRQELPK